MTRTTRLLLSLLAVTFAMLHSDIGTLFGQAPPQAPARDVVRRPGADSPVFRLRGRVLAGDTGAPLRRAVVHVTSAQLSPGRSTITDLDGNYEFRELPAGTYYVTASKTGFLTARPGNELVGADSGDSVQVSEAASANDGRTATARDIALTRACAIGGRVLDEVGDPVGGVLVRLLRLSAGTRREASTGSVIVTNDLGQYRAPGLLPGIYYVYVDAPRDPDGGVGEPVWYAPTYYPGTADASAASPVDLGPGQDFAGADIVLALAPMAAVSGVALDSHGRPAANAAIRLQPAQKEVTGTSIGNFSRVQPSGNFAITGVPTGDYVLTLALPQAAPRDNRSAGSSRLMEFAWMRVGVAGSDVTGITIQTSGGCAVTGQVVYEGTPPPRRTKLTVMAYHDSNAEVPFPFGAGEEQVEPDGTFSLPAVFGSRLFRVNGLPSGWALKAVYINGRDMIDTPVSVDGRSQLTSVQMVVTDRVTHVTARVAGERDEPAGAAWVLIVPEDPQKSSQRSSRFVARATAGADGTAKVDGLPAGDYVALAVRQVPRQIDTSAPDVLEQVRKAGVRFSLQDGDTRDIVLALGRPPSR